MQKKKAISLIVLVITIIVMIVLAGAIILSLNNSGIIEKANQAVKVTDEATVKELAQMAWAEAYANNIRDVDVLSKKVESALTANGVDTTETSKYLINVTEKGVTVKLKINAWIQDGLTVKRGEYKLDIGQEVNYTASGTTYAGKWKVLGADADGNLLIMSDADVATGFSLYTEATTLATAQSTWLSGGVNKLNTECAKYGKGTGAIGARSITAEDVNKVTGYDKTTYFNNAIYKYENEVIYTYNGTTKPTYTGANNVTADLTTDHTNGFYWYDEEGVHNVTADELKEEANKGKEIARMTNTYYGYAGTSGANKLTVEGNAYKMIFGTSNNYSKYWLASPFLLTDVSIVGFGMCGIKDGNVYGSYLWSSSGDTSTTMRGVRAVVTISSDVSASNLKIQ